MNAKTGVVEEYLKLKMEEQGKYWLRGTSHEIGGLKATYIQIIVSYHL